MDINRDALLLYLRDLRDMEIAKYQIGRMIQQEEQDYQKTDAALQKTDFRKERPEAEKKLEDIPYDTGEFTLSALKSILLGCLGGFISFCIAWWSGSHVYECVTVESGLAKWIGILFFGGITLAVGGWGIFYLFANITDIYDMVAANRRTKRKNEEIQQENKKIRARNKKLASQVKKHNAEERVRQEKNTQLRAENRQKWSERKQFLQSERSKVEEILQKGYGENILAVPHRNLESVYYIYDYMSTSQASLGDTLIHEHLEDGFQRILARLDVIVENQAEEIFSLRRVEAQNKKQIAQMTSVLDSLDRMERDNRAAFFQMSNTLNTIQDNTYQASQYAQQASQYAGIAATYSAVNAYFSGANYLH